jgi:hypothetical protein
MKAGDIVYAKLTSTTAVTTLVSTRVYPSEAPLDVDLPCVYYDVQLAEAVDGSAPMAGAQVQVGCLAHTEAGAHGLANAVHGALDGLTRYSGGTWLRGLALLGRTESRDADNNLWGVLLVYGASVTF